MITQSINLNMIPEGIKPIINVSQNDYGEQWAFNLFYGREVFSVPAGAEVYIQGTKADGTTFREACSFIGETVTATVTAGMTNVCGVVCAEICIEKGDSVLHSLNFYIRVEKTP